MSAGRVSDGPVYITEVEIHTINEAFRLLNERIDHLTGLSGTIQLYNTLLLASSQYATATEIANVAATEDPGTSTKIPRGDHVHAHGSGYLPNAHHNQVHAIDGADHTGNLDAAAITFTPNTLSDWTGSADPGQTDDALDQLAGRTKTLETSSGAGNTDQALYDAVDTVERITDRIMAGSGITITELADGSGDAISIASTGGSNALLDGSAHSDTVAQTVSRGSLVYGNSTPAWDELTVGVNGTVLTSDGTDVSWQTPSAGTTFTDQALYDAVESERISDKVIVGPNLTLTEQADGSGDAISLDVTNEVLLDDAGTSFQFTDIPGVGEGNIYVNIDGGGSAITTGVKGDLYVPFSLTLCSVTLIADQSGSIVIDIWNDTLANAPPTVADTITASDKPTLSTAITSQDNNISTWTTAIAGGTTLRFNVDSITTVTRVQMILGYQRLGMGA